MQANDHRLDLAPVVALQQIARRSDADLDHEMRIMVVHARDQRRQLRPGDMVADADDQALPHAGKRRERVVVRRQQLTGRIEKHPAPLRQLHMPRRALDQPAPQPVLEPPQLQADRGLRRLHRLGGAGEAAELGNTDEGLDLVQVERMFGHFQPL